MAIVSLGLLGTGSSKAAATTLAVTNTTGALIPAGTLIHITGCWDNIASVTAPTITSSAIGGGTATANHATAIGSGITTTAGAGVWHQCFRALTTASIAIGAVICTLTSNQSAVARAAHAVGWSGVQNVLRGTVATGVSTTGVPTAQTAGTTPVVGDLIVGSASFENNAQMTADADIFSGSWSSIVGTFTTGGGAATNVGTASQFKVVTGTGVQGFDPTGGVADAVACVYSLQPVPEPTLTQAAYRFYADGTESGSTALAAQSTSYTADLSSGDVNLAVRLLLQSTNTTDPAATDDWQLQWKRGGDAYDFSNYDGTASSLLSTSTQVAQSFTGGGEPLTLATFYLSKVNAPTGTVSAALWAHDGGTFGGTGLPTGSPLATSTNSVTASTLPTSPSPPAPYTFNFDGTVTLTAGTRYFIGLIAAGAAASPNLVSVARDASASTHPGALAFNSGSWNAASTQDLIFEVGTWTSVSNTDVLADSYTDNPNRYRLTGTTVGLGQSFLGNGMKLTRVDFDIGKGGTPPGNVAARLYAHTGSFGTITGVATGSPLAISASRASTSFQSLHQVESFIFDGTVTLAAGTPYVIAVDVDVPGDATNYVEVGYGSAAPTHPGCFIYHTGGWSADTNIDVFFKLYTAPSSVVPFNSASLTDGGVTTNRLTGGTGAFQAGKVSEDGLADNLGWTANNYTEVLYSFTVKQADLANGDTVRFRVLRNGAITGFTYTQTPTLSITKTVTATGRPKIWTGSAWVKKPLKVWNGSTWVEKPVKVWTGSTWKTVT